MTDPTRQQIVLAVQRALRGIAGEAAGFFHTVKASSVSAEMTTDLWQVPYSELPYFIVMPDSHETDRYQPSMVLLVEFPVLIVGRMDAEAGSIGTERLRTWERLFADVERALTHDPVTRARDLTLGGLVTDIRLTDRQAGVDVGLSRQVHVRIQATTKYRRLYGEA